MFSPSLVRKHYIAHPDLIWGCMPYWRVAPVQVSAWLHQLCEGSTSARPWRDTYVESRWIDRGLDQKCSSIFWYVIIRFNFFFQLLAKVCTENVTQMSIVFSLEDCLLLQHYSQPYLWYIWVPYFNPFEQTLFLSKIRHKCNNFYSIELMESSKIV